MVFFQEQFASRTQAIQELHENNSGKKRKWEEEKEGQDIIRKDSILLNVKNLETPLPSALDDLNLSLHSPPGNNLYDDENKKNITFKDDSRKSQERKFGIGGGTMSLDLELNLHNDHSPLVVKRNSTTSTKSFEDYGYGRRVKSKKGDHSDVLVIKRCPSWMSLEEDDEREMIAMGCMRCHMLVMLNKTSPSCPNCKFMHPPNHQTSLNLFLTQGLVP